jgi:putative transposase
MVRFPRFKGKRNGLSCRFSTGAFGLTDDRRHVKLPRVGEVRTHESTRKLARHVERGTARIRSATVSYRFGRWFCSFSVEITRADAAPAWPDRAVGVDLGVCSLAVLSTGEIVPNPRHLEVVLQELRRLQRQAARRSGPDKRICRASSNRWHKTQARITRLHTRVAHARRDGLHKLTTRLARSFGTIVLEELNVSGMLRNRSLARAISDASWSEFRSQLEYKAAWYGREVIAVDQWFPSSKTCSACGLLLDTLPLGVREWTCPGCGVMHDRDVNASRTILAAGLAVAACGGGVRPTRRQSVRQPPVKQEIQPTWVGLPSL